MLLSLAFTAPAQTVKTVYSFGSVAGDGSTPYGELFSGSDGYLYGTTSAGGSAGSGTAFKMTVAGVETILHHFGTATNEPKEPESAFILVNGTFYGTSVMGGLHNAGTIYSMTNAGVVANIFSFTVSGGGGNAYPDSPVLLGTDNNFYGVNNDSVFGVTPAGVETVLFTFSKSSDGLTVEGVIQGKDGNFYGTTLDGGTKGLGTVFKLTPAKVKTILHSFGTASGDGSNPTAPLIQATDGNFYGTTNETVFKITPQGALTTLYINPPTGIVGIQPRAPLFQASDGNFYGTTFDDDTNDYGAVFKITPSGVYTLLYVFGTKTNDGRSPSGGLVAGADGNLYGTTTKGGAKGLGTVFQLVYDNMLQPVSIASSNANPTFATLGDTITLTMTSNGAIQPPVVSIDGVSATVTHGSGNTWTASVPVTRGFPQGAAYFNIVTTDLAGNVALPVTAVTDSSSVNLDYLPPAFTAVTLASNNANPKVAKAGDTLTLKFTSTETIHTPTVSIAGHPAVATHSGNNWTATVSVTSAFSDGAAAISIAATDLTNNPGVATATSDGNSVTLYLSQPSFSQIAIASTNANPIYATAGDHISLSFVASTGLKTPTVSIAGQAATVVNPTGSHWVASVTVPSSIPSGLATLSIAAADLAGNVATPATATTDGSGVTIDLKAPTFAFIGIASANANPIFAKAGDAIALTFASNETILAPTVTIAGQTAIVTHLNGNSWTASVTALPGSAEGPVAFSINATDLAGNVSSPNAVTTDGSHVTLDITPPSFSAISIASTNANPHIAKADDAIVLSFTAIESIQQPIVTIDGIPATVSSGSGNSWTASVTIKSSFPEGPAVFSITATDLVGNVATPVVATTDGSNISVDLTPPTVSNISLASTNSNPRFAKPGDKITLTFTASEPISIPAVAIGGQAADVVNSSGNIWTATTTLTAAFPTGAAAFSISFGDVAGNAAPLATGQPTEGGVTLDPAPPEISPVYMEASGSLHFAKVGDNITVYFTASHAIRTPTVSINGRTAAVSNPSGNLWNAFVTVTADFEEGPATFSISATDLAGNVAPAVTTVNNGRPVTIYLTPAVLTSVTLVSSNPNPHYAKVGDTISLSFTASHPIYKPTVIIANQVVLPSNPSGNIWQASTIVMSGTPRGSAALFIRDIIDLPENVSAEVTATTDSSAVVIDTDAPVLNPSGVPLRGYLAGQNLPDLRGLLSTSDANGPVTLTQSPAAGSLLPSAGPLTVAFSGMDAAGNSAQAQITISVSPAQPDSNPVAAKGATVSGLPSGTNYAAFGAPETGAFAGKLTEGKKAIPAIFATDGGVLLQVGASLPDRPGTVITKLGQPSGDAVLATLKPGAGGIKAANSVVLLTGLAAGAPVVAAQAGTAISGLPIGVTVKKFGTLDGNGAFPFFLATLQGAGVTPVSSLALCTLTSAGHLNLLAYRGEIVGEKSISTLSTLVGSPGTLADERWRADDSTIGVRLGFNDQSQAIYHVPATAAGPADWTLDAQTGPTNIPGLQGDTIASFGLPGFGPQNFAVLVHLAPKVGDTTSTNKTAIITGRAGGEPTLLVRQADSVTADSAGAPLVGVTVKALSDPIVGYDAAVAYEFTEAGATIPANANAGIAFAEDGIHPLVLANTGGPAPGGGHWSQFSSLVLPKAQAAGPIFVGALNINQTDAIAAGNNLGLWGVDVTGSLGLLLRTGQSLQLGDQNESIKSFLALAPASGSIGAASGYDSEGNLAVLATFLSGGQSVIRIATP